MRPWMWLLLLVSASPAFAQECGTNVVTLADGAPSPSTKAVRDTSNIKSQVSYDLTLGKAFALVSTFGFDAQSGANLTDLYTVVGPVPNAAVAIHARLHVTGSGSTNCTQFPLPRCSAASGLAGLAWNATSVQAFLPKTTDQFVELPISVLVGVPFRLDWNLIARVSTEQPPGSASYAALLEFPDLPAGMAIVSCAGYHADGPVPVTLRSWGSLKASYR